MYGEHDHARRRRLAAGAATLAIHAGLAAILIWGLAEHGRGPTRADEPLLTVAVDPPKLPPPPPTQPAPSKAAAKAAPAPEGVKGEAMPREAPKVALPFPMPPAATVAGEGSDANGGAGSQRTGSGAGGIGTSGGGGGGGGGPAVRIAGALRDSDYPREAEAEGLAGTVAISFRVRSDGAVDRCTVARSSGSDLLDGLTCRLFTQRFRFRPATNGAGQPIDSTLSTSFTWGTRRRR